MKYQVYSKNLFDSACFTYPFIEHFSANLSLAFFAIFLPFCFFSNQSKKCSLLRYWFLVDWGDMVVGR